MKILLINCGSSLTYFKEKGLDLDVSYKVSDFVAPLKFLYEGTNEAGGKFKLYTPNITEYLEKNYKTEDYDFIIWGYDPSKYGSELNSTGGYSNFARIKGGAFWASVRMDVNSEKYLTHEMHHLICNYINLVIGDIKPKDFMDQTPVGNPPVWKPYYKNDTPQAPDSNHSATWNNIIPFLPKLNAVRKAKYKYFTENEVKGLKEEFVRKLDIMREQCGFPFKIESGLRTQAQNDALADSVSDSAHLSGLAVDIRVVDSPKRFKLLQVAFNNGIRRIGIGRNFIHLDMDNSKPQDVAWDYYK